MDYSNNCRRNDINVCKNIFLPNNSGYSFSISLSCDNCIIYTTIRNMIEDCQFHIQCSQLVTSIYSLSYASLKISLNLLYCRIVCNRLKGNIHKDVSLFHTMIVYCSRCISLVNIINLFHFSFLMRKQLLLMASSLS